ncbi:MAG: hypothetical protein R2845_00335 [Thermomicrobiales bacterium]
MSAGVIKGVPVLDLDYNEDSSADVDFNVIMTSEGNFVEVQGTAEGRAFPRATLTTFSTWPPAASRNSSPLNAPPSRHLAARNHRLGGMLALVHA